MDDKVNLPDGWHKYTDKLHELTQRYLAAQEALDAAMDAELGEDVEFMIEEEHSKRAKALLSYLVELLTGLMNGGVGDPEYNGRKEEAADVAFEFYIEGWRAVNDKSASP